MGALGGLTGSSGGAGGTGFSGPNAANLLAPTNGDQISQAYSGTQNALSGQQALLQALQGQNGLQNQNQVYGQLQGVASGAVNPAQAQFNQNTSQNVANQAALMAGQRGASQNVGLMARQAAQTGAGIQQQAVGQEAAQQAQNQIGAIGQAGQLANTQAGQQIGQTNANVGAQQSEQANLLNALQGYNSNQVSMQSNINSANAGLANTQLQGQQALIGGVMNGAGAAIGAAEGGAIGLAAGGVAPQPVASAGPTSMFGQFLKGAGNTVNPVSAQDQALAQFGSGSAALQRGASSMTAGIGKKLKGSGMNTTTLDNGTGATDLADTAPEVMVASSGGVADYSKGAAVKAKNAAEKAVVPGNSYANDRIPAVLTDGEGVLDVETMQDPGPIGHMARALIKHVEAKKRMRR